MHNMGIGGESDSRFHIHSSLQIAHNISHYSDFTL